VTTLPGAGGLPTLRVDCDFAGAMSMNNSSTPHRLGLRTQIIATEWRELVVAPAAGVAVFNSSAFGNAVTMNCGHIRKICSQRRLMSAQPSCHGRREVPADAVALYARRSPGAVARPTCPIDRSAGGDPLHSSVCSSLPHLALCTRFRPVMQNGGATLFGVRRVMQPSSD